MTLWIIPPINILSISFCTKKVTLAIYQWSWPGLPGPIAAPPPFRCINHGWEIRAAIDIAVKSVKLYLKGQAFFT